MKKAISGFVAILMGIILFASLSYSLVQAAASSCVFTRDLYAGSSGSDVKCLQQYLNTNGFTIASSGSGSLGNETNYFGMATEAAVIKWQITKAISPASGYFGTLSRAKYQAIVGSSSASVLTLTSQQEVAAQVMAGKLSAASTIKENGYTEKDISQYPEANAVWSKLLPVTEGMEKSMYSRTFSWADYGGWELSVVDMGNDGKSYPTTSFAGGLVFLDYRYANLPEDQIAFLLAHEMYFAVNDNTQVTVTYDQDTWALVEGGVDAVGCIVGEGGSIAIGGAAGGIPGVIAGTLLGPVECAKGIAIGSYIYGLLTKSVDVWVGYLNNKISQENQETADGFAASFLVTAGFNYQNAIQYLKNQASSGLQNVFQNLANTTIFSSLPSYQSRIDALSKNYLPPTSTTSGQMLQPSTEQINLEFPVSIQDYITTGVGGISTDWTPISIVDVPSTIKTEFLQQARKKKKNTLSGKYFYDPYHSKEYIKTGTDAGERCSWAINPKDGACLGAYYAIDFAGESTDVTAASDGIVKWIGEDNQEGKYILINGPTGSDYYTFYAHLASTVVTIGQHVNQGYKIGTMGNTGSEGGNIHLHFQVLYGVLPSNFNFKSCGNSPCWKNYLNSYYFDTTTLDTNTKFETVMLGNKTKYYPLEDYTLNIDDVVINRINNPDFLLSKFIPSLTPTPLPVSSQNSTRGTTINTTSNVNVSSVSTLATANSASGSIQTQINAIQQQLALLLKQAQDQRNNSTVTSSTSVPNNQPITQNTTPSQSSICVPSWNCGAWSACVNGQQTRTCTDLNPCGATTGKPSQTQSCTIPTPAPFVPTIPKPAITFTTDSGGVGYGQGTTIRWSSSNATACTASAGWSGSKSLSGSQDTGPLNYTQTFVLTCTGPGGSDIQYVSVNVFPPLATVPVPPTNLVTTALSSSSIMINWQDNANNESGFKIERKVQGEVFSQTNTINASPGSDSTDSYKDSNLLPGTNYCYRVRAYSSGGDSSYSNESCVTTGQVVVAQPSTNGFACGSSVNDIDGNSYDSVRIGNQCWLKQNLKVAKNSSGTSITRHCYNNEATACDTDGGLYDWNTAMNGVTTEGSQGICPDGWHIPNDAEWYTLESGLATGACPNDGSAGRCVSAGTKMKSGGSSGFEGILAGLRNTSGVFQSRGAFAYFWSSTLTGQYANSALIRTLVSTDSGTTRQGYNPKDWSFSVRCLKN